MKREDIAGRFVVGLIAGILGSVVYLVLELAVGCYKCRDSTCSELPPGGEYPVMDSRERDAGGDR